MSSEQTNAELLPCPFCGSAPTVTDYREIEDQTGERYGYAAVECNCLGSHGGLFFHFDTLAEAIEAWNRRPSRLEAISEAEPVACEYCGGEGRNSDGHCANCHGSGWVWAEPRHTPPAGHVVVPGADEAFDALDLADALIERGYGTQVPKEWTRAYRRVAKARAALPHNQGGAK